MTGQFSAVGGNVSPEFSIQHRLGHGRFGRPYIEYFPPSLLRGDCACDCSPRAAGRVVTSCIMFRAIRGCMDVCQEDDAPRRRYVVFVFSHVQVIDDTIVWAATTKNDDYIKMQGLKQLVTAPEHRKEIVAGGLWEHCVSRGIPLQILFTLRAVQYPASIPVSITSLHLVMNTTQTFIYGLFSLLDETRSVADQLSRIRNIYEVGNIPNKIADGKEPYPENQQTLTMGMAIEFRCATAVHPWHISEMSRITNRNVSFKYPGSEGYALHNVSFKIERGQLCVGLNNAISANPGINGRRLSLVLMALGKIKDNIGLGDPDNANDEDMIMRAATLGGAKEFVDKLPEGFNTYLERPVRDYYSGLPEGTKTLFGRPVDYSSVRTFGNLSSSVSIGLSGGQMQRIAL
ncbi:P-loop containing nucleoside triphosphate hydrolase protein [Salix suchowensis]|nr:P-loop containing nucleoside triphosphate hydrolase protein [Salix suchowensis]